MPITTTQLLADQSFWFADFPSEDITVGGTTYSVKAPFVEDRNEWQMGGLKDEPKARVIFDRNSAPLPSAMPAGTVVQFRSADWRVVSVREDFSQSPLMVELESARLAGALQTGAGDQLLTGAGVPLLSRNP